MVEHHGSFVWYELMTTDMAAARDVLRQRRGLGRAGRVDAGSGLHFVYRCRGLGQRADGLAGGREKIGV